MEFMKKVNEISKVVGKTATETYNTLADKSGKAIEDVKMKMMISDKEDEIEVIYKDMGKTVYDTYKTGEDVGKVFSKEGKKIDKLFAEIEEMKKVILYNKGLRTCDNCNEVIAVESVFCQNCGSKQKPVKLKKDKKEKETVKEEPKEKVCAQCGLVCEPKAKFCAKCGYSFEK